MNNVSNLPAANPPPADAVSENNNDIAEKIYCLFCATGREGQIETFLKKFGINVINARAERHVFKSGKRVGTDLRPLFPGYVFFKGGSAIDWTCFWHSDIYYVLKYKDGERGLRGADLDCARWLLRNNGIIRASRAIEVGKKIRIIEGPLKDYEGCIIAVRRRQQYVTVRIEGSLLSVTANLAYSLVTEIDNPKSKKKRKKKKHS